MAMAGAHTDRRAPQGAAPRGGGLRCHSTPAAESAGSELRDRRHPRPGCCLPGSIRSAGQGTGRMAARPARRHSRKAPVNIWNTPEREQLRKTVRSFTEREILPNIDEWERGGELPRDLHRRAGAAGLLGAGLPEAVGGGGGDGADSVVICEEVHQAGAPGGVFASLFTCGIAVPHMIASGEQRLIEEFVRPTLAGEEIGAM